MTNYLSLLIVLAAAIAASGRQTIYVSPNGKDEASGRRNHPVRTIDEAVRRASSIRFQGNCKPEEPIEISLSEGEFPVSEPIKISNGISSPLIFSGKGMGKTVISGGIQLPSFKRENDSLWTINLKSNSEIQQLFVNGKRATRARTPNGGKCFSTGKVTETIMDTVIDTHLSYRGYAVQEIHIPDEALSELRKVSSHTPEQLKIEIYHAWDMTRRYVDYFSVQDSSIFVTGQATSPWNHLDRVSQFRLVDDRAFVDEPGEWFYDKFTSILYYYPRKGESPESATAVVPSARQLLLIEGCPENRAEHLRFQGISFAFTRYTMPRSGNDPHQGANDTDACIMADFADDIIFEDCEISHTGENGIWFRKGCRNCSVERCYIHDLGAGAVKIGDRVIPFDEDKDLTKGIVVDNCILRDGGHEFAQGEGVMIFHSSDNRISYNEICDFYYTGISVGWEWGYAYSPTKRNEISHNHIHHLGWGLLSDMGGIYTLGASEGTRVTGNVIHHIHSHGYGGWGLYTDEGSSGIVLDSNLVHHCKCSSFHQHYGKGNIIRNNIFADGLKAQLEATRAEDHLSYTFENNIISFQSGDMYGINWEKQNAEVRNNLYWHGGKPVSFNGLSLSEWQENYNKDRGSIIADPMFRDPSTGDYTPTNGKILEQIGFKPFDITEAGVYGKPEWTVLSGYNSEKERIFMQLWQ